MNVLVACEESQRVCKAFLDKGHNAYSCDLVKCDKDGGGIPERHILMDALAVINGGVFRLETGKKIEIAKWDLIIAHPPCTYLSHAATRHHSTKMTPVNWINGRTLNRINAMQFFMSFVYANCEKIAIENPVGVMNTCYRKPDQIIHPYYFADSVDDSENYHNKRTCLWLKNLNPLLRTSNLPEPEPMYICQGEKSKLKRIHWAEGMRNIYGGQKERAKARSKTFPGIAKAMAEQWG